ncbi:MAG: 3'-5' exonuclease [Campylobacterota bacterium]|nr:3'-5' exonuclease [Campylobacterota bacterium]
MFSKLKRKLQQSLLKDPSYSYLFDEHSMPNEYIVLDTETTGLNPKKDEILSIGAVKIKNNQILTSQSFEIFIKPLCDISEQSIKIHHIRPIDIHNGVSIDEALEQLLPFIGNLPIVGYYISFDIKILNTYLKKRIGTTLPNEAIELSSMYYKRYKKSSAHEFVDLKFDTIMENLDIPRLGKHDALNDAVMSAMMFLKLKEIPLYKGAFS